ncbi:hypothetical protein AAG906_027633 [Vitis piasezkii]
MKRDHLSECGGCGSQHPFFLCNVRHRGTYRRLCPSCVLKNHPGSFCPVCFEVYSDSPPPSHQRLTCFKCPSISHLACAGGPANAYPGARYQCPPCSSPNFSFFSNAHSNSNSAINRDTALALVAASRIASASMKKAAAVARVEAERRVKEASLARKRAREALERLAYLVSKDKDSKGVAASVAADHRIKSIDASVAVSSQKRLKEENFGSNGVFSVRPVSKQLQHPQSNNGNEG